MTVITERDAGPGPTIQPDGSYPNAWGPELDPREEVVGVGGTGVRAGSFDGFTGTGLDGVYVAPYEDGYANGRLRTRPSASGAKPAPSQTRRAELATFLRSRRERLTPEAAGIPAGSRRRTPGLRREEVAQLAGVGVTWYTWLEQGRRINASTQVLDAIARTLKLDRDEHDHLYRLADVPALTVPDERAVAVEPEVLKIMGEMSSLCAVINERFDILAFNHPYALVFPSLANKRLRYRNSLWCTFTGPGCCNPFVNRTEEMPHMVATMRAAYGRHVGEPLWERFIGELTAASPEFARMWRDHEVHGHSTRRKIFRHPVVGELDFMATNLGVLATPGTRMVVYVPTDDRTRDAIAKLEAGVELPGESELLPCGHKAPHMRA